MKVSTKRIFFLALIIINCCTIFYFSNQVADDSSMQSSRWVEAISKIIPFIRNMQEPDKTILKEEILTPIVRKMAHLSLYACLGVFTFNFMLTFEKLKKSKMITYSIFICMLYASTDEFHQTFVAGRSGEIRDVVIDTIGALIGITLTYLIIKLIQKIKGRKDKQ